MARMSRGDTIASIEDGNAGTARCAENVPSRLAVASSNPTTAKRYGRVDVGGATAREIPTAHDDRRALFRRVERTPRAQTLPRQRGLRAVRAEFPLHCIAFNLKKVVGHTAVLMICILIPVTSARRRDQFLILATVPRQPKSPRSTSFIDSLDTRTDMVHVSSASWPPFHSPLRHCPRNRIEESDGLSLDVTAVLSVADQGGALQRRPK